MKHLSTLVAFQEMSDVPFFGIPCGFAFSLSVAFLTVIEQLAVAVRPAAFEQVRPKFAVVASERPSAILFVPLIAPPVEKPLPTLCVELPHDQSNVACCPAEIVPGEQ